MPDPTPEQRVAERVAAAWVNAYVPFNSVDATTAALNAVRAALASDDPAVVRAMAERVGHYCGCAWCCTGTPREQRGQGHAGCRT